jgi:hypothetical protein
MVAEAKPAASTVTSLTEHGRHHSGAQLRRRWGGRAVMASNRNGLRVLCVGGVPGHPTNPCLERRDDGPDCRRQMGRDSASRIGRTRIRYRCGARLRPTGHRTG